MNNRRLPDNDYDYLTSYEFLESTLKGDMLKQFLKEKEEFFCSMLECSPSEYRENSICVRDFNRLNNCFRRFRKEQDVFNGDDGFDNKIHYGYYPDGSPIILDERDYTDDVFLCITGLSINEGRSLSNKYKNVTALWKEYVECCYGDVLNKKAKEVLLGKGLSNTTLADMFSSEASEEDVMEFMDNALLSEKEINERDSFVAGRVAMSLEEYRKLSKSIDRSRKMVEFLDDIKDRDPNKDYFFGFDDNKSKIWINNRESIENLHKKYIGISFSSVLSYINIFSAVQREWKEKKKEELLEKRERILQGKEEESYRSVLGKKTCQ